jgi:DNA-binding LytR/AlgR family response regulator
MDETNANLSYSTVYLKTDEGLTSFYISDILCFQIENEHVIALQLDGQVEKVHHPLSELESMFTTFQFFRIHAKSLINLSHIKCYNHKISCVTLNNGKKLSVAKKRKRELNKLLYSKIPVSRT